LLSILDNYYRVEGRESVCLSVCVCVCVMKHGFTKKGVTYCRQTNIILNCLFCNIINRLEPGTIVYENLHYCVFRTIQPVTSMHLLVVPRRHLQNVSVLEGLEGISEVESLISVGREALMGLGRVFTCGIACSIRYFSIALLIVWLVGWFVG